MENVPAYAELRSKFVCAKTARRLIKENNLKFRHGFFSSREIEMTKDAVAEFLGENGLTERDLEGWLVEDAEFPRFELARHVTSKVPYRTFKSIITFITWWYNPQTRSKFSEGDDQRLVELVEEKGFRWKEIGMALEKWRDRCRHRFLRLRGLEKRRLQMRDIAKIVRDGVPVSEDEWEALCGRTGISRALLTKYINQYLKRMPADSPEGDIDSILLCAYILVFNFYCTVSIDLERLAGFLRGGAGEYLGQKETGCPQDASALQDYFDLHFRRALPAAGAQDLRVEIEIDDIFWTNIVNEFQIGCQNAKSRFYALVSSHGIRTFEDLYRTLESLSWGCFAGQVRRLVLTDAQCDG